MKLGKQPDAGVVAIVTERRLFPPHRGNRARIIELIRSLRWAGFRVILISREIARWSVWLRTQWLVDEIVPIRAHSFSGGDPQRYDCAPFVDAVALIVRKFDPVAVVAEYLWMTPCLEAVPRRIPALVDTHDVMHIRGRMYGGLENGAWVDCSRDVEARLLSRADIIIAIQRNEQELFRAMVPERPVVCVPHCCPPAGVWLEPRRVRDIVAYVGSDNPANVRGLESFLKSGWPLVRRRRPTAELRVFGTVAGQIRMVPAGVTLVGPVRSPASAYGAARVVVNPATLGTGLKIKNVEALARGRALVTTSRGSAGLEDGIEDAFLVADDMETFGSAVADLLCDDKRRTDLEVAARSFARQRFSREAVLRELLEALRDHRTAAAEAGRRD